MFRPRSTVILISLLFVSIAAWAAPAPLGSTVHNGGVTFRVWAPYVDSVAVRIGDAAPVPMAKEPGHPDAGDTTWAVDLPNAKAGDVYKYVIQCNGNTGEFIDPRGLQLTDYTPTASSVVVDMRSHVPMPFNEPPLRSLIIYEMHIGSFNQDPAIPGRYDFAGTAQKLDYLQKLGVNAIQLLPINENAVGGGGGGGGGGRRGGRGGAATQPGAAAQQAPATRAAAQGRGGRGGDYDWGYDPSSYFGMKTSYGTPAQFVDFVNACHAHGIAVIVDVVYNHMSGRNLLRNFGGFTSAEYPNGIYFNDAAHGVSPWGPRPDFSRPQVAAFLEDNALMYMMQLGCDGERWDSVANMRSFTGRGANNVNTDGIKLMQKMMADYRATQPGKILIAEDLRNEPNVTKPISQGGIGFNTQWDNNTCAAVRRAITGEDAARNLAALAQVIDRKIGDDPFARVIYSEDHDQVGHPPRDIRVPAIVDPQDPQSLKAKKLSTLAAAIILTSPGVPMLFQGQEMLDPRTFTFGVNVPMDWSRVQTQAGTIQLYQDMIALRRNIAGKTGGLEGGNVNVFRIDEANHTIAYRRWDKGGAGDDVIVAINLSQTPIPDLNIGFPAAGKWKVRFNSGSTGYDPQFKGGNSTDVTATQSGADGLTCSGHVAIGAYSVVIFSQD
ncbi:MAG TPA: alpha-amylase family glycosyl hydrolase [Humisphaera sp.]|jgi:1,4-alpha-glucan branching enzyme|nr:alpha-amylase family glycosyl hydrolase [Humisphaera sp.]